MARELDGRRLQFLAGRRVLLLGQVAEARCTQLANPKYTYIAKIAKRFL
jgi:amidase